MIVALLMLVFSFPTCLLADEDDWGTSLYWEGNIASDGSYAYLGRLYYTRLAGGGATITGISFSNTPPDGCTITIPETVCCNGYVDSVYVVNRPGKYSSAKINNENWRNTPLRWKNAPNSFALSLPGTLHRFCPFIKGANYNSGDTWVQTMTVPNSAMTSLIVRDNNNARPSANLFIDDHALYDATFGQCFTSLKSVTFGKNSVKSIGHHAFDHCPITTISQLPDGLVFVGSYAFGTLHVVQDLHLPTTLTYLGDYAFGIFGSGIDPNYGWFFHNQLTIPSSLKYIGTAAFVGSRMVGMHVTIPEGVQYIGGFAFGNTFITSLSIPSTVTEIRGGAFRDMKMLQEVTFKANQDLAIIGNNLFAEDNYLRYVDMSEVNPPQIYPFKITRGAGSPFSGLKAYTVVYLPPAASSIEIPSTEVNFVKYGDDGQWQCPNFVVYDYSKDYDLESFDYSKYISSNGTGFHYAPNSMTEEEKAEVDEWKASFPAKRGCDYELPHPFVAANAEYLRALNSMQRGRIITVTLPYSTTVSEDNVRAYKLVSEMELEGSKDNKGLWFLSIDDERLSYSSLTQEELNGCLTACHPYVLKVLTTPTSITAIDGENYAKLFASQNASVPASDDDYFEVDPTDGSSVWSSVGTTLNIDQRNASDYHFYVLSNSVWQPVCNCSRNGYVHSMRAAMQYKGTGQAKSFPKMLDSDDPFPPMLTGIESLNTPSKSSGEAIYTLDGRYAGTSLSLLPAGVYIMNGKKVIRKRTMDLQIQKQ